MKTSIVEVGLATSNVPEIQLALQECLIATGDLLIGHQIYDDQTLFVVRLLGDTLHSHLAVLSEAFRKQQLHSFQVIQCYLFKVVFKRESILESLRDFPLHGGESWFAAAGEEKAAYLCLNVPLLGQRQISWLATQPAVTQWVNAS